MTLKTDTNEEDHQLIELCEKGADYLKREEYSNAVKVYDTIIEDYPNYIPAYINLIIALTDNFSDDRFTLFDLKRAQQQMLTIAKPEELQEHTAFIKKVEKYLRKIDIRSRIERNIQIISENQAWLTDKRRKMPLSIIMLLGSLIVFPVFSIFASINREYFWPGLRGIIMLAILQFGVIGAANLWMTATQTGKKRDELNSSRSENESLELELNELMQN